MDSTLEILRKDYELEYRVPPLRSSGLKTWGKCRRRFLFEERLGLRVPGQYSRALGIGTMFHRMMARLYSGADLELAVWDATTYSKELYDELQNVAKARGGWLPGGRDVRTVGASIEDDLSLARAMAEITWEHYRIPDHFTPVPDLIEALLELDVPDLKRSRMLGRIDLPVWDQKEGVFGFVDFKTLDPRRSTVDRVALLPYDPARYFYRALLRQGLRRVGLEGRVTKSLHVVIQKPSIKFCSKDASWDDYIQRCKADFYEDRFKKNPDDPPVLFCETPFPTEDDPPWFTQMLRDYADGAKSMRGLDFYYPNQEACFDYGSPCPFLKLCKVSSFVWGPEIQKQYTQDFREDRDRLEDLRKESA